MNLKSGDLLIQRTLDEQNNQILYVEKIYIVLTLDELKKQITAVLSVDWICGYQRDSAHDYNSLLEDGYSIDVFPSRDVRRYGIYKKLDSFTYQNIGYEYCWMVDDNELTACLPYVFLTFDHKARGHIITSYDDDFTAAMAVYPKGNEQYVFGKRYSNHIVQLFDISKNVHTLGNEIPKEKQKK